MFNLPAFVLRRIANGVQERHPDTEVARLSQSSEADDHVFSITKLFIEKQNSSQQRFLRRFQTLFRQRGAEAQSNSA